MEEIDLREIFKLLIDKSFQIILVVLIFITLGVIYTLGLVTPMYESSTTILLTSNESGTDTEGVTSTDLTLNQKLVSTYSELITSKTVLGEVISNLNIDVTEEEIAKNITVTSVEDTEVIEISVEHEDANYAARIANEIVNVFAKEVAQIYNINNVHVVDEAEVETEPSNINHIRDILIFAIAGLALSVGVVLLFHIFDNTVKDQKIIEDRIGLTVLAAIPENDTDNSRGGKR